MTQVDGCGTAAAVAETQAVAQERLCSLASKLATRSQRRGHCLGHPVLCVCFQSTVFVRNLLIHSSYFSECFIKCTVWTGHRF